MPRHHSIAEHLGALIANHVPETPSKLSEDIVRCICAIYCKLATSPTQQMDIVASPTPSASISSTFSPRDACDSWSPQCHYEAVTSPSSFNSPKNKQGPYSGMIEVPRISIDGDRFGYASKMLYIFRYFRPHSIISKIVVLYCVKFSSCSQCLSSCYQVFYIVTIDLEHTLVG